MSRNVEFKLTVSIDGKSKGFSLGHQAVDRLMFSFDEITDEFIWTAASAHPHHEVRNQAACKDWLPADVLHALANDSVAAVRETVMSNEGFCSIADTEFLIARIKSDDVSVVRQIANNLSSYGEADSAALAKALIKHPDPSIRMAIAEGYGLDNDFREALLKDDDQNVSHMARQSMND